MKNLQACEINWALEKQRKGFLVAFARRNLKNLQSKVASQFEVAIFFGPHFFFFFPISSFLTLTTFLIMFKMIFFKVKHTLTSNEKIQFWCCSLKVSKKKNLLWKRSRLGCDHWAQLRSPHGRICQIGCADRDQSYKKKKRLFRLKCKVKIALHLRAGLLIVLIHISP